MSDLFGNHIVGFPTRRLIFALLQLKKCKLSQKFGVFNHFATIEHLPYTNDIKVHVSFVSFRLVGFMLLSLSFSIRPRFL